MLLQGCALLSMICFTVLCYVLLWGIALEGAFGLFGFMLCNEMEIVSGFWGSFSRLYRWKIRVKITQL